MSRQSRSESGIAARRLPAAAGEERRSRATATSNGAERRSRQGRDGAALETRIVTVVTVVADAVGALERIAYLLERDREPTYRVRAFRRAASTIRAAGRDQVADRARAGTLEQLEGIGPTTATVVAEAVAGTEPAYLAALEKRPGPEPGEGAALLALQRGDCHMHSDWSDGGSPIYDMAIAARDVGHEWAVLTDHSPRLTIAHGLTEERLEMQLDQLDGLRAELAPFRLLAGIEVDILEDGALDQSERMLSRLDVVVASVHSKLRMDADAMTKRMVGALASPFVDVLGHCTGRMVTGRGRPESSFDGPTVFAAAAMLGKAVEINCRPERLDPPRRLLSMAVRSGCLFSVDTDAHAPGQLEWQPYGCRRAAECAVEPESVVTTWPADRLLQWATAHRRGEPG